MNFQKDHLKKFYKRFSYPESFWESKKCCEVEESKALLAKKFFPWTKSMKSQKEIEFSSKFHLEKDVISVHW